MRIAFILDEPWDSALTDYAFKIYRLACKKYIAKVFCLRESYISKKVDNPELIKSLRNRNPFSSLAAFFDLYKKLKKFEPNIVVTIRGNATFYSCLLKKNIEFKLFRIFGENKKLKSPTNCIDKLILPCEYLKNNTGVKGIKDIIVLKNFIDTEKFRFSASGREKIRKKFDLDGKVVFGSVGRLDKVKGYELLIRAFAKAKIYNGVLFIVGEEKGIKKDKLIELARSLNLNNVIILTERRKDIIDIISSFDIGVISSIDSEVIPRVMLEFLSIGLPIVSTNIGCLKEIGEEIGAILSDPVEENLSKSLIEALKNYDKIEREEIAKRANRYSLELKEDIFKINLYK